MMKIYIICCVPGEISFLGKFLFLKYRPKCSQPIRLQDFFNQPLIWNKSVKQPDFLHVDTNSHKLKVDQKVFGWEWSKIGVAILGLI